MSTIDIPIHPRTKHGRFPWGPRTWPVLRYSQPPRAALLGSALAGLIGAVTLVNNTFGVLITAVTFVVVVLAARSGRLSRWEWAGVAGVLALASVSALRAAEWIVTMSTTLAIVVGVVVLSRAWTWTGIALGALLPLFLPVRVARWTRRGAGSIDLEGPRPVRIGMVAVVTVALCVVFAALFGAADKRFADALGAVTPEFDAASIVGRTLVFVFTAAGALAVAYVALHPPRFDRLAPSPRRTLRLWEWMVPLGAVVALFVVFVAFQVPTLFGGQGHVVTTEGLTNAEYARQGFWQLLAVTVLTLLVIAVTVAKARREDRRDRSALRALLGGLCLLSLVIVASALHRMSLYEQQYGYTTLRLFVTAVEWWLGSVFVLLLVSGVRMSGRWLPRAVGVGAVLTVLALAALNPDAYIARHNVDRFEQTGRIDTSYVGGLSADADAELERLPDYVRPCVEARGPVFVGDTWHLCTDPSVSVP
ncbi:DUF4173 domain-containing protein [Rhodococcus sp. IEGM 1381]|uniref:DUF4153 domain-containing protein n=1 Tax=Rhodococcus sp. IEGM 1381 TaxID=3047085 RepID=UPI0024B700BD|nr:DUF4173 domain-containing protein [Rhodococcus sp. IEGM 1381]MDI9897170.1 DUF4173 domain-containing protein [Rhodococcus sp. IEGM 1381]